MGQVLLEWMTLEQHLPPPPCAVALGRWWCTLTGGTARQCHQTAALWHELNCHDDGQGGIPRWVREANPPDSSCFCMASASALLRPVLTTTGAFSTCMVSRVRMHDGKLISTMKVRNQGA